MGDAPSNDRAGILGDVNGVVSLLLAALLLLPLADNFFANKNGLLLIITKHEMNTNERWWHENDGIMMVPAIFESRSA